MALGDIIYRAHPIYLGLTVLFAFIEMILTAILVHSYNNTGYPSDGYKGATRFLLFTSLWTLLFGGAYIGSFLLATSSIISSIASHGAFAFLTWLFWLAGAAALTNYTSGSLTCHVSHIAHCYQLNAAVGFAWSEFILFTLFFVFILFMGLRSSRNGNGFTGPLTA